MGDSIRLLQLGTAAGRDSMAVHVEYQGGLGGIGIGNTMVIGVKIGACPRGYVGLVLGSTYKIRRALVKRLFEILKCAGVMIDQ